MEQLRVAVIGAGALGGFFGGLLQERGHDVHYIARGETYQVLSTRGLELLGEPFVYRHPKVQVHLEASQVGPVDLVLLGVRSDQVAEVTHHLPALIGPDTQVVTMQNGVVAAEEVAAVVGTEHTAPGIVRIFNRLDGRGRVLHMGGLAAFTFKTFNNQDHPLLARLREELSALGVTCRLHPDIYQELWSKAMFMVPFGTLGGLSGKPMGVLCTDLREQFMGIAQEIVSVAEAAGVVLPEGILASTMAMVDKYEPNSTSSMQRDILAGRTSELDGLVGGVVRTAQRLGVATPRTSLVYDLLGIRERAVRSAQ